ncbi:DUF805 domain-containing protein [Brevundimonas diminuta]|uniref:DUF805 domain-containing protein n=1 Tax=Brevundimonas diminuta TaxID=293 RepID=UPI003D07A9DF
MSAIVDGFRRLTDFRGRDRRRRFWPYALVIMGLTVIGLEAAIIPMAAGVFAEATAYAMAYPGQVAESSSPGYYSVQLYDADAIAMPKLDRFFIAIGIAVGLAVVLLAAAVTRRLHDAGLAGWWGLPTVAFLATGVGLFPRALALVMQSEQGAPSMNLFFILFAHNGLYVVCLSGLAVLLMLGGDRGPNRYGLPNA